jgi:hypothetical protein
MIRKIVLAVFVLSLIGVIVGGSLTVSGKGGNSGGQSGTTLTAYKTASGFFEHHITYDWTLTKTASASSLTIGSSQSAQIVYTLTATRTKTAEFDLYGVQGQICVTNGGEVSTQNLVLFDHVQYNVGSGYQDVPGGSAYVDTSIHPVLLPGETFCYPYSITFAPIYGANYRNAVQVTITNHSGSLGIPKGPEPKTDFTIPSTPVLFIDDENATLNETENCPPGFSCVHDSNYGTGVWQLSGTSTISFTKTVTNDAAQCGTTVTLGNSAILVEGDSNQQHPASTTTTITTQACPSPPPPPPPGDVNVGTIGFWKNHEADTTALLPQYLGNYQVSTFAQAKQVFDAANSKNAYNQLAAQLLAAKLNVANGADSSCISATITQADSLLISAGYNGPNTTASPSGPLKSTVTSVKNALDAYNNSGC